MTRAGRIVVLNGAPRSGKSSIARAMQDGSTGTWMNIGVDAAMALAPKAIQPGIGLRPGGERPDLEPLLLPLYLALYDSIAAHARQGFDVVADLGHHDVYSRPLGLLPACARRLAGLNALLVGIRCPVAVNLARRQADPQRGFYSLDPDIIARWEAAVHRPGLYDLELDTSELTPAESAAKIGLLIAAPPSSRAFERLAAQG